MSLDAVHYLHSAFAPRSIAVVGASHRPESGLRRPRDEGVDYAPHGKGRLPPRRARTRRLSLRPGGRTADRSLQRRRDVYATSATCAHLGGPLDQGLFQDGVVTCPWHCWQFDVATGEAIYDPGRRVASYPVKVVGDDLMVEV